LPDHHVTQTSDTLVRLEDGTPLPITAVPSSATVVRGGSFTVAVSLPAKPQGNTVVSTVVAWQTDSALSVTGGAALTFTTGNFATPQNATITYATGTGPRDGHAQIKLTATGPDQPGYSPALVSVDMVG